ncbi:M13 family metallopeptidase [Muribaculum gordoncarteri]|jgi:putative endopeptidase|uniref:M13 family peptidase n=3 Tax=Muribaculum TaxID=1918540 RepID=A0A4V1D1L6_9BACT|nr:M13 family metallopeptidase [Muribaculum gordoncarteri]QCD35637.1 M13 family peptidase [Muribaculum gordoncarteri]
MNLLRTFIIAAFASSVIAVSAQEHLKSLAPSGFDADTPVSKDFYRHVNKGWMESHPLTPEYASYGQYKILSDSGNNRVRRIVTNLAKTNPEKGTTAYKIAALYESAMDSTRRNQLGAAPIREALSKIENTTPDGMDDLFIWFHKYYGSPFVKAGHMANVADSREYAMYVNGGAIRLGDRDYYLNNDKRSKDVREAYKKLIAAQIINAGYSKKDAARIVKNVMNIETLLADSTWTREESRNIPAMYNIRSISQVKEMFPNIPWDRIFNEAMGIDTPEMLIVTTINTVKQGDNLLGRLTDREMKDYYIWSLVDEASNCLSDSFSDANFEFNKVMSGVQEQAPRWKRALGAVEGVLGEGIGELYVAEYFPQSSKDYVEGLVENLRNALGKHIIHLSWMSDDTKLQALKKLNATTVKIGYPDKWKDYSDLDIDPAFSYWENMHNAEMWSRGEYLAKWGKPVDRTEWDMTPQTINAYANALNNEIVFPAGILQAPFYDPEASDAENYGGIGVVIGHELTHGFDDQGRQFDSQGNMVNWWTDEDAAEFKKLTEGLVDQYSAVEVLPGLYANGRYTLGENIADQGGLRIAMTAFLDSQKKKGVDVKSEEAKIDGFDPMQVFYLNFANVWANNIRDEEIRSLTIGDVHSLAKNRVNVAIRNLDTFFTTFGITDGDDMFRPQSERVVIW